MSNIESHNPENTSQSNISPFPEEKISELTFRRMLILKATEGVTGVTAAVIIGSEIIDNSDGFNVNNIIAGTFLAVVNRITNGGAEFYGQISAQTSTREKL